MIRRGKWGSSLANVSGNEKGTNIDSGGTLGSSLYGLSHFIPPRTKCNMGFNFYSSWSFDSSGLHDSVITTLKQDQDGIDDEDRG
jgi:hypothetical protein